MLIASMAALTACSTTALESLDESPCLADQSFYVVGHGRHSGIVVDREDLVALVPALAQDFSTGRMLEIGWGDERYYRSPKPTVAQALRAVLWPTSAVLHVEAVPEDPRKTFPWSETLELSVPRDGYSRLLQFVAAAFDRSAGGRAQRLGLGLHGHSYFYSAKGRFHAFATCNTWTAGGIAQSGFPLRDRTVVTAAALMAQLKSPPDHLQQCYSVK